MSYMNPNPLALSTIAVKLGQAIIWGLHVKENTVKCMRVEWVSHDWLHGTFSPYRIALEVLLAQVKAVRSATQ